MILVNVTFTQPTGSISKALVESAMETVLQHENRRSAFIECILLSDKDIQELNIRWLKHEYPTDVISFVLEEEPELEAEVYIGLETARRQAKEFKVGVMDEVARLAIHGTLHICGYDDGTDEEREAMRDLENKYLAILRKNGLLNQ